MWERFAYYLIAGVLFIYLIDSRAKGGKGMDDSTAADITGTFIALIWLPPLIGGLIADLVANTPGADRVIFSTHCQNDLGLSTANSLAGAQNGARQVMKDLAAAGVDFDDVTATLEREGVDSFAQSYKDLIATLEQRTAEIAA